MAKLKITMIPLAIMAAALASQTLHANTIDTFTFTQTGWTQAIPNKGQFNPGAPDPGGLLSGSFTGSVELDGTIQMADLTYFSALYTDSTAPGGLYPPSIAALTLFSFNTLGGSSSLTFSGLPLQTGACTGAATGLSLYCTEFATASYSPGTNGVIFLNDHPAFITNSIAQVALVSSVTTVPPPPSASSVPEPASLMLLGSGLVIISLGARLQRRRTDLDRTVRNAAPEHLAGVHPAIPTS